MPEGISQQDTFEIDRPPSLVEIAYQKIRESILMGKLRPGETLNEIGIANSMGISRTPVRQSLQKLVSEGLVDSTPRRGIHVKSFTLEDFDEVYEIRLMLVPAVVERIALTSTTRDFGELRDALEMGRRAAKKADLRAFIEADCAFHSAIGVLSGNRRLAWIMGNLKDIIQVVSIEALYHEGRMDEVIRQHELILDLMESGQSTRARGATMEHLKASREALAEYYSARSAIQDDNSTS